MTMPLDRAGAPTARSDAARGPQATAAPEAVTVAVRDAALAIDALAPEWRALAADAAEPNCFAEPWFIAASLATLIEGEPLRLAEVRRGGRLIGIIPLSIGRRYGRTRVRFVRNWWHPHLLLGTPLVRAGEESTFWSAVVTMLDAAGWAPNFLHVAGLVEDGPIHRGLVAAAAGLRRSCATVHREARAMLASELDSRTYYERTVRPKTRKEIRRLRHRLDELGPVVTRRLDRRDELDGWCDAFLALERQGWKGEQGTALDSHAATSAFFRAAIAGAWDEGRLHFLRLDLGDRPIAMLVAFIGPPGSFAFKTCYDEAFARYSPGVLIQLDNLAILDRADVAWMDSCAIENHPMIDSLWSGRRPIVRVTVKLKGVRRSLVHAACRLLELSSARVRGLARSLHR
ncbi:MAG: GNAT family N-acetyltransferase [Allosphingosinicella sp.]